MSRRKYCNPPTDALIMALTPYAIGAVVLFYLYKKSQSTVPAKIAEVGQASRDIVRNLPGAIASALRGENEGGYISQAEAAEAKKIMDREIASKKARIAAAVPQKGFVPFLYGWPPG